MIVARNPGSAKKATSYAERLRLGIAVIHGEQREAESDMNDGRYSPPTVAPSRTMEVGVGVPVHPAKEKPPINVVGDVGGRIAIMVVSARLPHTHNQPNIDRFHFTIPRTTWSTTYNHSQPPQRFSRKGEPTRYTFSPLTVFSAQTLRD